MLTADIGFDCPIGHYKKICPLAFTNYSQVFLVYDSLHRVRRIMKVIPQTDCCTGRPGEAFLVLAVDHPYVARALETLEWGCYSVLIFPRFTGGSMCDAMRNKKYRTIPSSAEVMFRLALAVQYLHRGRILHGDISPNNILFENDAPVLIDFGAAEILTDGAVSRSNIGTSAFCAPERIAQESTLASDIYSLGATFAYLIAGNWSPEKVGGLWQIAPHSLRQLVGWMMRKNPAERPSARECLDHTFFREALSPAWIHHEMRLVEATPITGV
jgi:serine/threonine protein kinase